MKILKLLLALGMLFSMFAVSRAQEGEQLFRANCASCHSIGKGKLVGPDLKEVHNRYKEDWLIKWIKSSQTLVKEGDGQAVKLYNDNNKVPMPDAFINEEQIKSVLAYVKTKGEESSSVTASATALPQAGNTDTGTAGETKSSGTISLNSFSFGEYMLGGLVCILMLIVWMMARAIRSMSVELERKYNSDDYL